MFIDKTEYIEKGIAEFPSLFIEGAAACGKSTAVNMFLDAHPEATSDVFYMDKETDMEAFATRLGTCKEATGGKRFVVFENMHDGLTEAQYLLMMELVGLANTKVLFVSREKPAAPFLQLLWRGQMGMIYPQNLMFSQAETAQLVRQAGLRILAEDVQQVTGGWPGAVKVLLHLAVQLDAKNLTVEKLMRRYEIRTYLEQEILGSLTDKERQVAELAAQLPWINVELIDADADIMENLHRKGMLIYNEKKNHWRLQPLLARAIKRDLSYEQGLNLGQWYEARGYITEATICYSRGGCGDAFRRCVIEHYSEIPFELLAHSNIYAWNGGGAELCWLRGMCCYLRQDLDGFRRELQKVQRLKGEVAAEVHLNLAFADPDISMEDWLALLEEKAPECGMVRLWHFSQNSHMLLSGIRELSNLFTCSTREEKRRMKLLREWLGHQEWIGIQLAKAEFDFETLAKGQRESEPWKAVMEIVSDENGEYPWRQKIACLYFLNRMHITNEEPEIEALMHRLKDQLQWEENPICQRHLAAVERIRNLWGPGEVETTRWLRDAAPENVMEVTEENYSLLFHQVQGYLQLNQFDHAGRILSKLIPYVKQYHRSLLLAELLFQQAVVDLAKGRKGAALRNVVASFLYTGDAHYVVFYVSYGRMGRQVLEAYVEWLRNAEPKKWQRKKRYNYGDVMKMPREDYLELILRLAKRNAKNASSAQGAMASADAGGRHDAEHVEALTLTETIVLQNINKGLSNAEICEAMNLKLPTVKTHISSVYKKLGANSRVQAVLRGKELGILK